MEEELLRRAADLAERCGERLLFVRCRCDRLKLLFRSHKLASSMVKQGRAPLSVFDKTIIAGCRTERKKKSNICPIK